MCILFLWRSVILFVYITELTFIYLNMYSSGHDVDDNFLDEMVLYESTNPMVLIKKKINKAKKELAHLLDILDQTPEVEERIIEVMTRLKTYKVITIISSVFFFFS
jgi:hypothetical protein